MKFYSYIFILQITFIILLPSDDMWNKVMEFYKEGKMKDFNKTHFIFDEYNYTKLDINDDKMKVIYEKQDYILKNCGIKSYIFAVKYINESIESFGHVRNNTRDNLRNFGIVVDTSIYALVSIDSLNMIIYTGNSTRKDYISDSNAMLMKNEFLINIRFQNYYNAFLDFVEDIDRICNKNFTRITTSSVSHSHSGGGSNNNWIAYIFAIIGIIIIGGLVAICCCCCKNCKNIGSTGSTSDYSYNNSMNNQSAGGNSAGGNSMSAGGNSFHSGGA